MRAVSSRKARWNARLNQREIWQGRTRLRSFPIEIQVGTNLTCNLHCEFCHREHGERERLKALRPEEREIPDIVLDRLMPIVPYFEAFRLTPLGEPLMYSRLDEMIERMRAMGAVNLELTTNGMLMTEDLARRLVELPARRVYFSIDSADPDVYADMRRGANLQRVGEGLDALVAARKRAGRTAPEIVIASTLSRRNADGICDMVEFAAAHGVDALSAQMMEAVAPEFEPDMLQHEPELARRNLAAAQALSDRLGLAFGAHGPLQRLVDSRHSALADADAADVRTPLIEQCAFPWRFLFVDTSGLVRPCCWIGCNVGDLSQTDFDAAWNSSEMQSLRHDLLRGHLPPLAAEGFAALSNRESLH